MSEGLERDRAFVCPVNKHGAYASIQGPFDAIEPTQDQALAEVEKNLELALADVRSMRAELATAR